MVHGIIAKHTGRIEVSSAPGQGTTVRVDLPLCSGTTVSSHALEPRRIAPTSGPPLHVLVVEDEEHVRHSIQQILALQSYRVTVAPSGEDALALPECCCPDLLLTDLMLPGIGGEELAARLVHRWPGLKVVFMSGYSEHEPALSGTAVGTARFLEKPFDIDTLTRELHQALGDRTK